MSAQQLELIRKPPTVKWTTCLECGAVDDLTGVNLGGLRLIPQRVHRKGQWPDPSELGTILPEERLYAPHTCGCSELLVWVRTEEDNEIPNT